MTEARTRGWSQYPVEYNRYSSSYTRTGSCHILLMTIFFQMFSIIIKINAGAFISFSPARVLKDLIPEVQMVAPLLFEVFSDYI